MGIAGSDAEVTVPPSPQDPDPREHPDWRVAVGAQLRCWFGAVVVIIVLAQLSLQGPAALLLGLAGFCAAAALLATLTVLVIESLSGRRVATGGHVLLAGAGLAVVAALLTTSPGWATIGGVAGLAIAGLGMILLPAQASWKRVALTLAAAAVVGLLYRLIMRY